MKNTNSVNVSGRNVDISEESINELEDKPEDMIKNVVWRGNEVENTGKRVRDVEDAMRKSSTHLIIV